MRFPRTVSFAAPLGNLPFLATRRLDTCSGLFYPEKGGKKHASVPYKQRKSLTLTREHAAKAGAEPDAEIEIPDPWALYFSEHEEKWRLSNKVLTGTLESSELDNTQFGHRVPLGSESMWRWKWMNPSCTDRLPSVPLPLSCVVLVENINPPLCFGELEMMRIGGGACGCGGGDTWCGFCGRTRENTATAQEDSRLCRLNAAAFSR